MNQIDLGGRSAAITGAAQGIGRATAERLLASGASVALWDRDAALVGQTCDELADKGAGKGAGKGKVIAVQVDVVDPQSVAMAVATTCDAFGGLDILVNNAGVAGDIAKTWDYEVAEWQRVLDIDLTGVFLCCRAAAPVMMEAGYGRIVNVASIAGKEGNPNACAYSAAKAGVIALTKTLGKELAHLDIAVNCITPAAAKTRIFDQITQEHIDFMLSKIPRGRFVQVDEIAALIAWLSSADCSFTTGAVFDISGGRATY